MNKKTAMSTTQVWAYAHEDAARRAWEIARDIAYKQGTGSKRWYGLAHLILTLPEREEPTVGENDMTDQVTTSDLLKAAGKVADIAGRITGEDLGGSVTGVSIVEMPGLLYQLKVAVAEYNAIVLTRSQQGCP